MQHIFFAVVVVVVDANVANFPLKSFFPFVVVFVVVVVVVVFVVFVVVVGGGCGVVVVVVGDGEFVIKQCYVRDLPGEANKMNCCCFCC